MAMDRDFLVARILSITPAPGRLVDERDILPFGTDGGIIGAPEGTYYHLNGIGDDRPQYAHFVTEREVPDT